MTQGTIPTFASAVRLHQSGRLDEAYSAYQALLDDPETFADIASNLSALTMKLGRTDEAEVYARQALERAPNHANAWNHLGIVLRAKRLWAEADKAFGKAIQHDPAHTQAAANRAEIQVMLGDLSGAVASYVEALRINPRNAAALTGIIHRKQQLADWNGLDALIARMSAEISRGNPDIDPFMLLFCCADPAEIYKACVNAGRARDALADTTWNPGRLHARAPGTGRCRIGYVSANFTDHAVGSLICQLIESHDRANFEIFCYCHTTEKSGARHDRIKRAADHFIEIDRLDDHDAARRIHDDGIDILVDLMGYTKGQRLMIFSQRPAPVQVTWLGFAGSVGGRAADYIIADQVVIPPGAERHYSEKPVRLPVCYQVNDSDRKLSQAPMRRADFGIPDDTMLFCNFNQTAKITPPALDLWAAIMREVPNSVIWLWALYPEATKALRGHFADRGIGDDRLHFGASLPDAEHLSRYALCDLFLDSFPYCGHATASNALFGGAPLLTLPGATFASRVSASLLTALGMTELIALSPADYVAKAVALARAPERRRALKAALAASRQTSPLFDGRRFTCDIERAYAIMIDRHRRGEAPSTIDLASIWRDEWQD